MSRTTHLALFAATVLAGCGDQTQDTVATPRPAASEVASADRYCAVTRELDSAGERHFSSLGQDATAREYEAAERSFVESQAAKIAELQAAAPPEVAGDVRILLAAQRERAGMDSEAVGQKAATAAETRLRAYEKERC